MALWRAEALKRLPELREEIDLSWEVMALWPELQSAFAKAYARDPPNENLIARIYSYADWCSAARPGPDAGHDPRTAVAVGFYEEIPSCPDARADMPRWFTEAEVADLQYFFVYHYGESGYADLLAFIRRNRHRYVPRDRPTVRPPG